MYKFPRYIYPDLRSIKKIRLEKQTGSAQAIAKSNKEKNPNYVNNNKDNTSLVKIKKNHVREFDIDVINVLEDPFVTVENDSKRSYDSINKKKKPILEKTSQEKHDLLQESTDNNRESEKIEENQQTSNKTKHDHFEKINFTSRLDDNHRRNVMEDRDRSECEDHRKNIENQLLQLQKEMFDKACIEYKNPDQFVFNDGTIDSPIMFVGEAPGEDEVLQGKPFVGKSGQLLQNMLDAAGFTRDRIYITNTVVWRPPLNRTPLPAEIEQMAPYLLQHIEIIKPRILVLVGGVSYRCAMREAIAISKIRGIWQSRYFCPCIMNIFHPSYLLRSPSRKRETWADILLVREKALEIGFSLAKGVLRN